MFQPKKHAEKISEIYFWIHSKNIHICIFKLNFDKNKIWYVRICISRKIWEYLSFQKRHPQYKGEIRNESYKNHTIHVKIIIRGTN